MGLLGIGGGGGGGTSSAANTQTGALTGGNTSVNVGSNNTVIYVIVGAVAFVGLIAILVFGKRGGRRK